MSDTMRSKYDASIIDEKKKLFQDQILPRFTAGLHSLQKAKSDFDF